MAAVRLFLAREEWAKPRGRKSHRHRCGPGDRGAAVLWPDQAIRGPVARAGPTALRRRRGGNRAARTRGRSHRAKEKKPLRADGRHCMSQHPAAQALWANRVAPDGDDASIRSKHRDEPRYGSRAGDPKRLQPPLKSQTAEARPAWAATSADKAISRRRQCLVRRRARGSKRHTRPGRCRHDDCARNCYCLSPTFSGYTNVRESECGMISSDSSW
jgi:hypothetical protein